jgi:lipopolysaccharide export system protein LptC
MAHDNSYSRAVVWAKVTLPLIALILLSSLFLLSGAPDPDNALPYAEVDVDQITREQRVTEPRFAGVLDDGRELVLEAVSVAAGSGQTERIRAQAIEGRMDLSGTERLYLEAALADFDMLRQRAVLSEGVVLRTSRGYRMDSPVLHLALDRVELEAPRAIHITGPGLDLTADRMELSGPEGRTILRFTGAVRMLYDPES